ncbi:unnamed protein product [Peniophora sp. CBMAI 1063]|nr:unnamed protein product [Peniophora sp. CBMAI 1063]
MACSIDVLQHDASPPPPAYHDGGAIERPPSYRHGHLVRHHPYGRHTHNLLQRLLLTPYAYEDYEPTSLGNDAVVGLYTGAEDSAAASSVVGGGEHTNTSSPASSTSARPVSRDASSSLHDAQSCSPPEYRPIVSTSRALKRKRDEFEGQGDPE